MIAIGSDHGGFQLKKAIMKHLEGKKIAYIDFGTYEEMPTDYPIYGKKVAEAILSKECEQGMASIIRKQDNPYIVEYQAVPVCNVANAEKKVPTDYINEEGNDVTPKMLTYLKPLIQGEVEQEYVNGIPKQMILY